ncbi:hypothetical protein [Marinifilum fragile]|uniref:hypothetical protein n=1 Tax=Marinifilum fragile TaxID=570161 RepID=UPI002AABCC8E|nr:hypothetical protein [Marinifilum fragile]
MDKRLQAILDIEISKLKSTDSVNPQLWNQFYINLDSVLDVIKESIYIYNDSSNKIPQFIGDLFLSKCIEFHNEFKECTRPPSSQTSGADYAAARERSIRAFNSRFQSTEFIKFYEPIYTIKSFKKPLTNIESEINKILNEKIPDVDLIISELVEGQKVVNTIVSNVRNNAKENITSEYATIFEKVWEKHKEYSLAWLTAGIVSTLIFIASLGFGWFDGLETQVMDEGKFVAYNIGNIIARVLILAIMIFVVSFSFKQYTINRHLQNINRHRANAFESYQLFDKLLPKKDEIHRNELMLQLAKAIYEQTSTGYLSEKGSNFNLSLTEITKMLGQNAPK